MSSFQGLCSYPHGGYASLGLFLTCALALSTTTYAVASCRMLVVTFTSTQGGFEETFSNQNDRQGETAARYKVGAGLFQWLRPFDVGNDDDNVDSIGDWSDGYCVGYQSTMLDVLSDTPFEAARGFAVFAVLLSVIVTLWSLLSACVMWNRIQIRLLNACLLAGAFCTGLTFLLKKGAVCQTAFQDRECTIDQGGLMLVAAVILWMAAFGISVLFFQPEPPDPDQPDNNVADAVRVRRRVPMPMPGKSSSWFGNANRNTNNGNHANINVNTQSAPPLGQPRQQPKADNGSKHSRTTASSSPTVPVGNGSFDYSYDSRKNWTNRIPRRNQQRQAAAAAAARQRQRPVQQQQLTVDDVTNEEQMEVYMAHRLDRMEGAVVSGGRDDDERSLRAEI